MGDLGFTLRAAAISWSWLTSSVTDSRSSGLTLSMEPTAEAELILRAAGLGPRASSMGEASEQPYEHLTAGKLWPTPRASPFADILASGSSPRPLQRPLRRRDKSGVSLPFLTSPGSCFRGPPENILPTPTLSLTVRRGASFCFG